MGYNFDTSAATPILKNRYTKMRVQTLAFMSALLAVIPKDAEAGGNAYYGAVRSAVGSTASHTATTSFSAGSSSVYNQWICNYASSYGTANVTGDAIDRTKGEANALVDAMVSEFDGAFIDIGQMLGADLFGDGGGSFGQIATTGYTTTVVTLAQPSQIVNFMQGQILQTSLDDGTGTNGVRAGTATVTAVDINLGTITANWTGITSVAAGDYIFGQGNYAGAYAGLAGWLPAYNQRTTLATSFNNVVRSADPVRLAGVAVNGKGGPKDITLINAASLVQRMGGRPDYCVLNPLDYSAIVSAATSRIVYTTVQSFDNAQLSFKAADLATEYGVITLLTDVFCPVGTAYLLTMNTLLMPSMGGVPRVWGEQVDGLEWLRGTGDSFQLRAVARAAMYISTPGKNAVVSF